MRTLRTRAALVNCVVAQLLGELREGVCPDNLDVSVPDQVPGMARVLSSAIRTTPDWRPDCGTRPVVAAGQRLLSEMEPPPMSPAGSRSPRRWSATCSPIRCCRPHCSRPTGPDNGCGMGGALSFVALLLHRRDAELQEAR